MIINSSLCIKETRTSKYDFHWEHSQYMRQWVKWIKGEEINLQMNFFVLHGIMTLENFISLKKLLMSTFLYVRQRKVLWCSNEWVFIVYFEFLQDVSLKILKKEGFWLESWHLVSQLVIITGKYNEWKKTSKKHLNRDGKAWLRLLSKD